MEERKFKRLFQIALVLGVVILAMNDKEGWGWLIFVMIIID